MNELQIIWDAAVDGFSVFLANKRIWIPTGTAWVAAFFYSLHLKTKAEIRIEANLRTLRKSEKEMRVYGINFVLAFILYLLLNPPIDVEVVQDALSAGVVAVFLPLFWFKRDVIGTAFSRG